MRYSFQRQAGPPEALDVSRRTTLLLLSFSLGACGRFATVSRCEVCPTGQLCDVASGQCVPEPSVQPPQCRGNASCPGDTPICSPAGRCVQCVGNGDCPGGACDMQAGRCVPRGADSCAGVTSLLEVGEGTVRIRGTTLGAANDAQLGCGLPGAVATDVVYGLKLAQTRRLSAVVRAIDPGSGFQPVLALRSSCADARSELSCGFVQPGSDRASLSLELKAGNAFLWVDGESQAGGEFELELSFDAVPAIDACAEPGLLRGGDTLDVTGETQGLSDDLGSSCGGAGAPDAIYSLVLDRSRRVKLEVTGVAGFRPTLALRGACLEPSTELACAPGSATGIATIELPGLGPGTYSVIVDGSGSGSNAATGRFRLRVTLGEPAPLPTNDTCQTALELPMGTVGSPMVLNLQGDTSAAKNDLPGCEATGADLVYTFELAQARRVRAVATPLSGSRLQPVLSLRRDMQCESQLAREQLLCTAAGQPGFPASLDSPRLDPGRWFLIVDGKSRTSGAFDLSVEFATPPTPPGNDTCAMPTPLTLEPADSRAMETTVGAQSDAFTCAGLERSPDVVYTFTLPTRQSVAVDVRALTGSALLPVLTLKPPAPASCSLGAALPLQKCGFGDLQVSDRAVLMEPELEPGTWFLWVSGELATQGAFSLRVGAGAPIQAPGNDSCGTLNQMVSLTVGSGTSGDTRGANNTVDGACGFPFGANGEFGRDVAYTFQVSAPLPTLTITVRPEQTGGQLFKPVIFVRGPGPAGTCTASGPNLGCQGAIDYGMPAVLTLNAVAPGAYTLWVDGAGTSAGAFGLTLR